MRKLSLHSITAKVRKRLLLVLDWKMFMRSVDKPRNQWLGQAWLVWRNGYKIVGQVLDSLEERPKRCKKYLLGQRIDDSVSKSKSSSRELVSVDSRLRWRSALEQLMGISSGSASHP